jgi:hypothetical protein
VPADSSSSIPLALTQLTHAHPLQPTEAPDLRGYLTTMLGRRLAATTGTPSITTLPQGTWAPWTATIGSGAGHAALGRVMAW